MLAIPTVFGGAIGTGGARSESFCARSVLLGTTTTGSALAARCAWIVLVVSSGVVSAGAAGVCAEAFGAAVVVAELVDVDPVAAGTLGATGALAGVSVFAVAAG